jgi:hypothetical protein
MVDASALGLLVTLGIDIAIFFALIFVYIKLKDFRSKPMDPDVFPESEMPLV